MKEREPALQKTGMGQGSQRVNTPHREGNSMFQRAGLLEELELNNRCGTALQLAGNRNT